MLLSSQFVAVPTFAGGVLLPVLQVEQKLLNFQYFTWVNQFALVYDLTSQLADVCVWIQTFHTDSTK